MTTTTLSKPTATVERAAHFSQRQPFKKSSSLHPQPEGQPKPAKEQASPMLTLAAVSKIYRRPGEARTCGLSDINLILPKGGFLFVTGPSGSGKTTLLKLLYGAESPSQGSVTVNDQMLHGPQGRGQKNRSLGGDRLSRFRRQLGVVFQDYKLIPNRTVSENVAFALWAQGCPQAEVARRLAPTLRLVGLQHKADSFPTQLSGGEQQRVSLARAIVGTPPLILADEPTGNLDPENSQQVIRILDKLNRMGATVVVTTHDLHLVQQSQHPVIQLQEGKLSWLRH
jgi:cell division transport system ATP-binding protein